MTGSRPNLAVACADGVAEVVIDRDDIRNALAPEVRRELLACLRSLGADPSVRAVVLTGAGRSFSAGGSIRHFKDQATRTPVEVRAEMDESAQLFRLVSSLDKPVIAAVNGHALGGGCALAIACDLTLASDRATFGFPELARGFVPALAAVVCMQRTSLKKGLELLLGAQAIDAPAAVEAGLANRVVPHDGLMDAARELARRIAGFDPDAVGILKQLVRHIASSDRDDAFFAAREVSTLMRFSKGFSAGVSDFLSRDKP